MTGETATSPAATPPPEEHQPLPQNPLNSAPISAVPPFSPQATMESSANSVGVVVNEIEEPPSYYKYLDSKEYADKYRRYEFEFKQMLMAKYFSGRDPNEVNLFEEETTIDGEIIKSSKWPCTHWYAGEDVSNVDPIQCFDEEEEEEEEEEESKDLASAELTTPGEISKFDFTEEDA